MAISTCSRCGKADAETDSRKWYITELTQYKEKYLGPAFGGIPPGTLTLKAWKFKLIRIFETNLCIDCQQKVLKRLQRLEQHKKRFAVILGILCAVFIILSFFPGGKWWIGAIISICLILISLESVSSQRGIANEHYRLYHDHYIDCYKEHHLVLENGMYFLSRSPKSTRNQLMFNESEYQLLMENEKQYLGWSMVKNIFHSVADTESEVTTELVAKHLGSVDEVKAEITVKRT